MRKYTFKYCAILSLCFIAAILSACTETKTTENNAETITTTVIEIEQYGHTVLDITAAEFSEAGYDLGDVVCIRSESFELKMPYFDGYYSNPGGTMLRGITPDDQIAVCINYENFAETYDVSVGDTVEISMAEKAAMLTVQEICRLQYTNEREDYSDDATFANFRVVTAGNISEGKLFRSSSPVNNKYGRATYAHDLMQSAGIVSLLNASDSKEEIEEYFTEENFTSEYYRTLYETGYVMPLDLGADYRSDEFAATVAKGLTFFAKQDPPFLIHCREGKDRTGFICMILEALMGADLEEIIDDYMMSFYNYYGVTKDSQPEKYQAILDKNLLPMMYHVMGVENYSELEKTDLEAAITEYLLRADMTQDDISALKEKLN